MKTEGVAIQDFEIQGLGFIGLGVQVLGMRVVGLGTGLGQREDSGSSC